MRERQVMEASMRRIEEGVRVLVVDDEATIREVLTDFLTLEGFDVTCVSDGEEALEVLETGERFDVALLDMKMPGMSGLEVLAHIGREAPHMVSLMMTGFGTVETAIEAMKLGAFDYVLKPFKVQEVIRLIVRGLEKRRLEAENIQLREAVKLHEVSEAMAGAQSLDEVYGLLVDAARQESEADAVVVWVRDALETLRGEAQAYQVARRWARSDLDRAQLLASGALELGRLRGESGWRGGVIEGEEARRVTGGAMPESRAIALLVLPLTVRGEVLGYLALTSFQGEHRFKEGKRKMLEVLCGRASAAIENSRLYGELQRVFKQTIQALANLLEDKDPYTRGHSERVSRYARQIAQGMGLSEGEVEEIADCALMHDIGKMGIRYEDLNKIEPLTEAEYEMFKSHTTRGKWILEPIAFLHHLIPGVYHHHERWDGRGYPLGLKGEEIPLVARVLAIADTYDAMTSHRAYRRALPHDVAMREIQAFAGAQFDPALVEVFARTMRQAKGGSASKAQRWGALREERLTGSLGGEITNQFDVLRDFE